MTQEEDIYEAFAEWLTPILTSKLPKDIAAFNFNLYEDETSYHIQLIAAKTFSEDNEDWACDEIFSSGENIFVVSRQIAGKEWIQGLDFCKNLITKYLESGIQRDTLRHTSAVATGFVGGDLLTLFRRQ